MFIFFNCVLPTAILGRSLNLRRIFCHKESILKSWWKNYIFPLSVYVYMFFRAVVFAVNMRVSHPTENCKRVTITFIVSLKAHAPLHTAFGERDVRGAGWMLWAVVPRAGVANRG